MILPDTICLTGSSTFLRLIVVCRSTSQRNSESSGRKIKTYRYLGCLKDIFRHAAPSDVLRDRVLDFADELLRELHSGLHQQEQQHSLVFVFGPPLSDAHAVLDLVREPGVEHVVHFCASESHARRVQHAVCAPVEVDLLCGGVDGDEI